MVSQLIQAQYKRLELLEGAAEVYESNLGSKRNESADLEQIS